MDTREAFLRIAENERDFGQCDSDTAANLINNEESFNYPITRLMFDPAQTNPNGSIRVNQSRQMLESGSFGGAAETLASSRLYSFYKPYEQELFEKEELYKKTIFDDENIFSQFANDFMYSKYSLEKSGNVYKLAKARQEGDLNAVLDYEYKINELDKKLKQRFQPTEGATNSTANLLASVARTSPETFAVAVGAGIVTAMTGGLATPLLATAGATALNGLIIYNDTFNIEAGGMYEQLENSNISDEEKIKVSEDYGRISAFIESSSALFGVLGFAARPITKGISRVATKSVAEGSKSLLGRLATKSAVKKAQKVLDDKIIKELSKKGIGEKLKDPKYVAFIGKRMGGHILASGGESGQEVAQEVISDAFLKAVEEAEDPNNIDLINNIGKVLSDGSNTSKYASIAANTAAASLILSGTAATGVSGVKNLYARSLEKKNVDDVAERIMELKSKSQAYKKSPKAFAENTANIVGAGNAPETVSINTPVLLDVLDNAEKNGETTVLQKLNELGVTRESLEKDTTITGQTKLDFAEFDNVVLDPNDKSLYQKIKGQWTTDETVFTKNELDKFVKNLVELRPELKSVVEDEESNFNKMLSALRKNKNLSDEQAVKFSTLAQFVLSNIATIEGGTQEDGLKFALEVINTKQSLLDKAKNIFDKVKTKVVDEKFEVTDEDLSGLFGEKKLYSITKESGDFTGNKAMAQFQDVAQRINEIDAEEQANGVPEYTKPTININGVERPTKNSKGNPIAKSEKSLKAFYNWFGDSKVVDEQGRPLVVYHGSNAEFDVFDKKFFRNNLWGAGFYFTNIKKRAEKSGKNVYSTYLKIEKPYIYEKPGKIPDSNDGRFVDVNGLNKGEVYFVVKESNQIKSVDNKGTFSKSDNIYYSKTQDQQIAGVFSKELDKYVIRLTEATNPVTFLHEFFHFTATALLESYNRGKMTPYWQKQLLKMAKFVGADPVNGKLNLTTEQHEKLAEAFTTYLKEGKMPVEGFRDIFNRIAEWFIKTYKALRMKGVRLNKSVRSAFDSLLFSKEEIDKAIIDKNLRAIGRRDWISEDDYQAYLSELSSLSRVSSNKHLEAIRKKTKRSIEEGNNTQKEIIRRDVEAEIGGQKEYMFEAYVLENKINKNSIPSEYKIKNRKYLSDEGGLPIQHFVTNSNGLARNFADVISLLNNLPDKQEIIEAETQERFSKWLEEKYPEYSDADAKVATANEKLLRVRIKEYLMLNKIPLQQFEQYFKELKRVANKEVAGMSLREMTNIEKWLNLETKIVTKQRFAKSDTELANLLWHQAAVNYIIMRSKEVRKKVKDFNRHFKKYKTNPTTGDLKRIDSYDFDLIVGLLKNIGYSNKRPRIRDVSMVDRLMYWIDSNVKSGFTGANQIMEYIDIIGKETGVKFDKNTYGNFSVFDVLLREIESISEKKKGEFDKQGVNVTEKDSKEIVETINNKGIYGNVYRVWADFSLIPEQLLKKILPERIFNKYVLPYINSHANREKRIEQYGEMLYDALKNTIDNRNKIFSVGLTENKVIHMTYEEMQVAIFNIDNMNTWLRTFNKKYSMELTEGDFLKIVESAPEQMIKDAESVWAIFDSQKEEFRKAQYEIDGFLMDYVEPIEITLSDGRVIKSGYFPRGKIPTTKGDFEKAIMPTKIDGVYHFGISNYAKDREAQSHDSLDLTINSIRSWLYHTATVIEVGPAFNKLKKIFDSDNVINAFGEKETKSLNDWLNYSVVGDNVNKLFSNLDKISTIQILGFMPIKFIIQSLGFVGAINEVGILNTTRQMLNLSNWKSAFDPTYSDIRKLSKYMDARYGKIQNHLAAISEPNQLLRKGKSGIDFITSAAMVFTAHGDAFSSSIVWRGSFEKAISQGKSEQEAVLIADSAVRRTQGDTSSVSRPPILRGDKRFLTKFASYFVSVNSRISSSIIGKDRLDLVTTLMLAGILAPTLEAMLRSLAEWEWGDDDDKKKWRRLKINSLEDLLFYNIKTNIAQTVGSSILPVGGLGGYAGTLLSTGSAYENPLPMFSYGQSVVKTFAEPVLALTSEGEERDRHIKKAKKSALKTLTVPNKYIKMIVD